MCEYCIDLLVAMTSGDPARLDEAEANWYRHKVAPEVGDFRELASDVFIDKQGSKYDGELEVVEKAATFAISHGLGLMFDAEELADAAVTDEGIAALGRMFEFFKRAFWYGLRTGMRDDVAREILSCRRVAEGSDES